jgi:MoaA/NifB/PqqE/SkfB family radical SAM enzyme
VTKPASLPLLTLYLTERCNSRCVSCDYWRHGGRDTTLASVLTLLPELEALRTRTVLFSGGEPLLHPEWPAMAAALRERGISCWLLTSGLALAKHAARVAHAFDAVTVSLDGTCAPTYQAIRGLDAFDRVCEGVRRAAAEGARVSLRVTVQRANYRELPEFVTLAHELGATQVSFLAVDVGNQHAFARSGASAPQLALGAADLPVLDALIARMESEFGPEFRRRFIAESPQRLRALRAYFAALLGAGEFPPVRCNAPEFSAVIDATGVVAPCFFIPAPATSRVSSGLRAALDAEEMVTLRETIRAGGRTECARCVCPKWRDPAVSDAAFELPEVSHA